MAVFQGTSSVTNGSATVVFTGPTLSPLAVFPGAQVSLGGYFAVIASITNTTSFVLTSPFTGTTGASVPTTINTISENESDIVTLNTRTADLIEDLLEWDSLGNLASISPLTGTGVLYQDATGAHSLVPKGDFTSGVETDGKANTIAQRNSLYGAQVAGFSVLVADTGDGRSAVYFKNTNALNDWSNPAYLTGEVGPTPVITASATTLSPGSSATVTETPITGGINLDLGIPAGEGFISRGAYSGATAYIKGDVVLDNNSSWIAKIATTGNTPPVLPTTSNTQWQLLAAKGADGTGTGDFVGPPGGVADGDLVAFADVTGKRGKKAGLVSNSQLATVPTATFKGRGAAGTGAPEDLTATQALTLLKAAGAYAKDNIVGTVTQVGGVPTGAIIERGNNANGNYAKFANGTLLCTKYDQQDTLGGFTWVFPHAFNPAPDSVSGLPVGARALCLAHSIPTQTSTFITTKDTAGNNVQSWVGLTAIGRWF